MDTLDEKCLNCGGSVKYFPKKEIFICEYCRSKFTLDELKKNKEKLDKVPNLEESFSELKDLEGYHCKNCGADIIVQKNTSSTRCVYCRSYSIIKNRLTGVYKPSGIIPFKYLKEDAIKSFKDIVKGRLLIPKDFSNLDNISDMEGLYVPFFLYDMDNKADITASCTRVRNWTSGDYNYTETKYYEVKRGGELNFLNVPNDASIRFDDKIMNAIEPFDYSKMQEFDTSYLSGYLSEKYDVKMTDAYKNVLERIKDDSKEYLRKDIKGYSTTIVKNSNNNVVLNNNKYVLLPVWVLNINYKGKIYHFAMNGESSKLVGEIPVSKFKLFLTILITFVASFLILLLLFKLSGYRW